MIRLILAIWMTATTANAAVVEIGAQAGELDGPYAVIHQTNYHTDGPLTEIAQDIILSLTIEILWKERPRDPWTRSRASWGGVVALSIPSARPFLQYRATGVLQGVGSTMILTSGEFTCVPACRVADATFTEGSFYIAAVPLPASGTALLIGLMSIAALRRSLR